jgi:hypothetical protein
VRRRPAVQKGALAAGFHRCDIARFQARGGVPDPENPTMNGDQSAGCEPGPDLRLGDTCAKELLARDYPV